MLVVNYKIIILFVYTCTCFFFHSSGLFWWVLNKIYNTIIQSIWTVLAFGRMPAARLQSPSPGFHQPPSEFSGNRGDDFRYDGSDPDLWRNRPYTRMWLWQFLFIFTFVLKWLLISTLYGFHVVERDCITTRKFMNIKRNIKI